MIEPQRQKFERKILAEEEDRVRTILGQNAFDGFEKFFQGIMDEQQNKKMCCVAFITRRCFCLAHIFLQILRQAFFYSTEQSKLLPLPGKDENKDNITLMTDTALVNYGWKIGRKIARIAANDNTMPGRDELTYLPDIILVDDAISYGRALTGVLGNFQRKIDAGICGYFEEKRSEESRDFEKEERRAQLLREDYLKHRVEVRIYAEKSQTKVLGMLPQSLLTTYERMDPPYWNDLSVRLSEAIRNVGVANAAFIASCCQNSIPRLDGGAWKSYETDIRGHKQTVFLLTSCKSAFCTVRFNPCGVGFAYRAIPFVFLPELKERTFTALEEKIFDHLAAHGFSGGMEQLKAENDHLTYKSRLEFVTLFLSISLLRAFFHDADCLNTEYDRYAFDWNKIYANYSDCTTKLEIIKLFAEEFAAKPPNHLLMDKDALLNLLNELPRGSLDGSDFLYIDLEPTATQRPLAELVENYFFERSIEMEHDANWLANSTGYQMTSRAQRLDRARYSDSVFAFVKRWVHRAADKQARGYTATEVICVLLQAMDDGLSSVVADQDRESGVVAQQIRICEQGLAARMRRYYCHLDVLNSLESNFCITEKNRHGYLRAYLDALDVHGIPSDTTENDLIEIYEMLRYAKQRVEYWMLGMGRSFRLRKEETGNGTITFECVSADEMLAENELSSFQRRIRCKKTWEQVLEKELAKT